MLIKHDVVQLEDRKKMNKIVSKVKEREREILKDATRFVIHSSG